MKKINKHIAIVRSGTSYLSSLSLPSADTILALLKTFYDNVEIIEINTPDDLVKIKVANPDLVFLGMKFVPSNTELGLDDPDKIWLSDYLDENSITYTGSSQKAHELELNKDFAKKMVRSKGFNTSDYYVRRRSQSVFPIQTLRFPMFIKPANRGGGLGVDEYSFVTNPTELEAKVLSISRNHGSDSLIEEFLPGREFSVAILKKDNLNSYYAMPIELSAPTNASGESVLSGEAKASNSEIYSAVTDIRLKRLITDLSLGIFEALGAEDYGRIDIRLDSRGVPHFLEANLMPSLIDNYGSFPKACRINLGLEYDEMILKIIHLGFDKQVSEDHQPIFESVVSLS